MNALFSWFFWGSFFLFFILYIANMIILFIFPIQINEFSEQNDIIYLGFYCLNAITNDLYLNWIPIIIGIFTIVLTLLNCLAYWLLVTKTNLLPLIRKNEIVIMFLCSSIGCLLIFILNIFNRPTFDITKLSLFTNGWNINPTLPQWSMDFNYVYRFTFVSDGTQTIYTESSLSKFSAIWILMMVITILLYIITFYVYCYHSQCYLPIASITKESRYAK